MDMPVTLEVIESRDFLRITLVGERSSADASLAIWHAIADHVQHHNAKRVLVVNKLVGKLPTPAEQKRIVASLVARGFDGVRLAIVSMDSAHVEELEYAELDSLELGRNVLVFGSEQFAILWLCHGENSAIRSS